MHQYRLKFKNSLSGYFQSNLVENPTNAESLLCIFQAMHVDFSWVQQCHPGCSVHYLKLIKTSLWTDPDGPVHTLAR